jgi:hypothetical protein
VLVRGDGGWSLVEDSLQEKQLVFEDEPVIRATAAAVTES